MIYEKYEKAELEIIKFNTQDLITTSDPPLATEEDELSKVN